MNKEISPYEYFTALKSGNTVLLAKAITLIESLHPKDQQLARELMSLISDDSANKQSYRIGITGPPGVGKSTFIDSLGKFLLDGENKIAVLTIDPSSHKSRGSILGDKTRMEYLSQSKNVFIRPSASGGTLGGIAARTREAIILCEAAGFNIIFVETVGVGQSEVMVYELVDCLLLLYLANTGDQIQGIKRGIMELADIVFINKADIADPSLLKRSKSQLQQALHILMPNYPEWTVPVLSGSGLSGKGIENLSSTLFEFQQIMKDFAHWEGRRRMQASYWFRELLSERLIQSFLAKKEIGNLYSKLLEEVDTGQREVDSAINELMAFFPNNS